MSICSCRMFILLRVIVFLIVIHWMIFCTVMDEIFRLSLFLFSQLVLLKLFTQLLTRIKHYLITNSKTQHILLSSLLLFLLLIYFSQHRQNQHICPHQFLSLLFTPIKLCFILLFPFMLSYSCIFVIKFSKFSNFDNIKHFLKTFWLWELL